MHAGEFMTGMHATTLHTLAPTEYTVSSISDQQRQLSEAWSKA
jgi:hypothetical protein